jgi:hypothetical protein
MRGVPIEVKCRIFFYTKARWHKRAKGEKHTTSEKLLSIWEKNSRFVSNAGATLPPAAKKISATQLRVERLTFR